MTTTAAPARPPPARRARWAASDAAPPQSSVSRRVSTREGNSLTVALIRRGNGMPRSSIRTVRPPPSQPSELGPKAEMVRAAVHDVRPPFRHRPASRPAVQRHVQRAVPHRVGGPPPPRPRVVRRKHAADEGDQRQPTRAVIAQRIDIPPDIAVRRRGYREVRSAISAAAASRPDSTAIGTPGPGCTLPPAR